MSPTLIITLVLGYILLLFVVSLITGKDSSNEAFFIGKKESPWYVVAFGMIGASLSGVTFISVPGVIGNFDSINGHFSYMQVALGYIVGYFIIATVLMPLYYRLNLTSIYSYLYERFGWWSYKTGAGFFILSRTIGASFRLFLVALVLQEFVFNAWNVPFFINVLFTLALIWVYTLRGGIKTIVWTDTLQTTFMLLAVCAAVYWMASDLGLGIGGLVQTISDSEYSKMFFWTASEDRYFFKQFISGAFIAIAMTGLDQDMMQKNNSCKNISEGQKNMFTFSIVLFFINLLFVSLGALMYIYASSKGIELPTRTDHVFPTLALSHFSPIIGILFLIGLIAAAYSSADSALTALTTSFCVDFLGFEEKTEKGIQTAQQGGLQKTRYIVHIGFTFLVFLVIMIFHYILETDVVTALFKVALYTYGPLLGLYAFGLFIKRDINDGPWVLLIAIGAPLLGYVINYLTNNSLGFLILPINGLLTFIGLMLISKSQK